MHDGLVNGISALGIALLHFLWQGTLLGLVTSLILSILRNAKPQTRYAVSCFAMLASAAFLVITFATTFNSAANVSDAFYAIYATTPADQHAAVSAWQPLPWGIRIQHEALAPWLVGIWALGVSLMLLRLIFGLAWVHRLQRLALIPCLSWQTRCDALAVRLGIREQVLLRVVDGLDTPIAAGWWRPVVMFPVGLLTGLPAAYIEALIAHELAHIRRHDYLVNLMQSALEALLFYHPVTWWLSQRIRQERELIADQLAVGALAAPRQLALALSALSDYQADLQITHSERLLAQRANGGQLHGRIAQLLRPDQARAPAFWLTVLIALALVSVGITSYAYAHIFAVHPVAQGVEVSEKTLRISYALVRTDDPQILAWGPDDDIDSVAAALPKAAFDLILVRRNGIEYLLTDPSLVAPARQIWSQAQAHERQLEALDQQLSVRQEALQVGNELNANAELKQLEIRFAERARAVQQSYQQTENYLHSVIGKAVSNGLAIPVRRNAI